MEDKNIDKEWADALHMDYDESRLRTTPPPVPGGGSVPPVPGGDPWPAYQGQPYRPRDERRGPMPPTFLAWAIVCTILCCTIPGIVAIVYSSQVSAKYAMEDMEGARRASRNAEIWIIASLALGVVNATLYLPFMLLS